MAINKKSSTTRLPQSLLEQIKESGSSDQQHSSQRIHSRFHQPTSRKEARKQERALRKQKKAQHFLHPRNTSSNVNLKRNASGGEHDDSPKRKKIKVDDDGISRKKATSSKQLSKGKTKSDSKGKSNTHTPPEVRSKVGDDEDAYIAYLESKLGLEKTKRTSEDDGLDDLLNLADSIVAPSQDPPLEDEDDAQESTDGASDSDSAYSVSTAGWEGITQDIDRITDNETNCSQKSPTENELKIQTDSVTGRYIPPHLRNQGGRNDTLASEAIQKLSRHLKGLLNRMSEQNIATIINSVEDLYRDHRRNDVTSTLTSLIITSISDHSSLLDSFVVVYAAFIASLHKIMGIDFAAHFVRSALASYERYYIAMQKSPLVAQSTHSVLPSAPAALPQAQNEQQNDGKECSNLLVLVSELYNFQVISSVLVFDVIRALLEGDLTEFKVELLLKLLRNSGKQLRQDDPSALKDIVSIVQGKVSARKGAVNSRTSFMIETLTNLKNNKIKRNVTQNQGGAAVERMKKFLANLSKSRRVLAHEPLRVSLEDFQSADTKGKWWLVGAAWGGDPLVDNQAEFTKKSSPNTDQDDSAQLTKLARAQGMNTDIRRGVFVVLMSSDDYIDACERLSQLKLTEIQQREIIRVLLHCCGNERTYNPYYTLVGQHLCRSSHAHKITLQYCLWDFLRDLGEARVGGAAVVKNTEDHGDFELQSISQVRLHNIAKTFGWWIAKDSVSLHVLKPVDFTVLKPRTQEFLRELFIQIFVNSQRSTPLVAQDIMKADFTRNRNVVEEIFLKASRIQALAMGLVYFLSKTFQDKSGSDDDGFLKFIYWAVGVAKDTLRTGIDV